MEPLQDSQSFENLFVMSILFAGPYFGKAANTDDTRPGRDMPFAQPAVPARATTDGQTDKWFIS